MSIFSLLDRPEAYRADTWDLGEDPEGREYWLSFYEKVFASSLNAARDALVTSNQALQKAIESCQKAYNEQMERLRREPESLKPFTMRRLDQLAHGLLVDHGLHDPFLKLKHEENVRASIDYARLVKAHDKLDAESLVRVVTEGLFAGNLFDLGRRLDMHRYGESGGDIYHTLDDIPEHPWCVDDYEAWRVFLLERTNLRRVMLFVDNAGADFVLGCVPFMRMLGKRGATVVLVANDRPCTNDMTTAECRAVLRALAEDDDMLSYLMRAKRLKLVGWGNDCPQLDFLNVPAICNEEAKNTDLLVLIGSARAIESNYKARFRCASLKAAVIKNTWVAEQLGGKVYDFVCKFDYGTRESD